MRNFFVYVRDLCVVLSFLFVATAVCASTGPGVVPVVADCAKGQAYTTGGAFDGCKTSVLRQVCDQSDPWKICKDDFRAKCVCKR